MAEVCPTCGSAFKAMRGEFYTGSGYTDCFDPWHKVDSLPVSPFRHSEGEAKPAQCPACESTSEAIRLRNYRGWGDECYLRNYFSCKHPWHDVLDKNSGAAVDSLPVEELVADLRDHYNTDWDTTIAALKEALGIAHRNALVPYSYAGGPDCRKVEMLLGLAPGSPEGTYACPICGCRTPHAHSAEDIAEWRAHEQLLVFIDTAFEEARRKIIDTEK